MACRWRRCRFGSFHHTGSPSRARTGRCKARILPRTYSECRPFPNTSCSPRHLGIGHTRRRTSDSRCCNSRRCTHRRYKQRSRSAPSNLCRLHRIDCSTRARTVRRSWQTLRCMTLRCIDSMRCIWLRWHCLDKQHTRHHRHGSLRCTSSSHTRRCCMRRHRFAQYTRCSCCHIATPTRAHTGHHKTRIPDRTRWQRTDHCCRWCWWRPWGIARTHRCTPGSQNCN